MIKPLELYIHIPFCVRKCQYCDFLSFQADERTQQDYVEALIRQIQASSASFQDYMVTSVYFGGGTPSWLEEGLMLKIFDVIYKYFWVMPEAEITMECNPGTVTRNKLEAYKSAGLNRLSIGLQSVREDELKLLGRIHTYDQFLKTYEIARSVGYKDINVDLMTCLPYQDAQKAYESLSSVLRLKPEHLSVYTLIIEKGTPFYDQYKFDAVRQEAGMPTEVLPTEDTCYEIYKMTQSVLTQAGYEQYEISNYAKPNFECRHNVGYWTRQEYLGLGLGAASLINNVRYTNTSDLYKYIRGEEYIIEENPLDRKAQMEEFMFLGLRMTKGVSRRDFESCFGLPIEAIYKDVLDGLKQDGLLQVSQGMISLTDQGMDVANYVMSKFLL